jgi:DNA-binding transcriptional LysR family regulator
LVTFDQVTIELILDDRPLDVIDERIDIAFQAGQPENKDLVARALWQATTILFASPNYMARKGEPRSIRDLQDHDFVVQSRALQGASIRLAGPTGLRTITPKGRFAVNSSRAALRAARAGLGIVLLPKILAKEALAKGELQQILPRFESEPSTFHLVYPTKKNLSAAARRFLEFILEVAPRKYLHARHGKETGSQSISASAR